MFIIAAARGFGHWAMMVHTQYVSYGEHQRQTAASEGVARPISDALVE